MKQTFKMIVIAIGILGISAESFACMGGVCQVGSTTVVNVSVVRHAGPMPGPAPMPYGGAGYGYGYGGYGGGYGRTAVNVAVGGAGWGFGFAYRGVRRCARPFVRCGFRGGCRPRC